MSMLVGERVRVKTWMAMKEGVVKRACKKHLIVILDGLPMKFSLKTMLPVDYKGENPPRLILDMKEYERDIRAREEWSQIEYPGLEMFDHIKDLIGPRYWKKLFKKKDNGKKSSHQSASTD